MLNEKMEKALNDQINEELYSSYLYLSMAAWFESENLPGCAAWMQAQAREENGHAMKFFKFINERRGRVTLQAIQKPPQEWKSALAAFEASLDHEQHITACIEKLMNLAVSQKDYASVGLLQWFVNEQVEEEANVDAIVQRLKMAEKAPGALLMLDHALGERK
ncbi:MAG TPA: ferritin [Sedimentisphaerales bacterium]|jgi:ferritin|nr:ferritin [Sedimentisphaerales bacterium]HNU28180.1 ferritin [Sedimentisphaerales bacterium]